MRRYPAMVLSMNAVETTKAFCIGGAVENGIRCVVEKSVADRSIGIHGFVAVSSTMYPTSSPLNRVSSPAGARINAKR